MAIGLGLLRLSPKSFWSMTPREFERAASIFAAPREAAPDRNRLAALMDQFPDVSNA